MFGFSVYESFESATVARTGAVPMPRRAEVLIGGHAVLMSLTNAISAIAVVGSIIIAGEQRRPGGRPVLGAIAVFASMTNIVSGFLITDRMLKMFKRASPERQAMIEHDRAARVPRRRGALHLLAALDERARRPRGAASPPASPAWCLAVVGTLLQPEIVTYNWIVIAVVLGLAVGMPLSRVPLTAVPQRTALSHAFGGLAAGLVGTAKYYLWLGEGRSSPRSAPAAIVLEVMLGFLTFTGSLMAAGKLQEVSGSRSGRSPTRCQNVVNLGAARAARLAGVGLVSPDRAGRRAFTASSRWRSLFGVLLIIPIGGADMPTVIAILNSYAGLSAVAMGFVLDNKLLITAGRARRLHRPDPLDHHVPRDEPLVHQRAVRRLRPGAGAKAAGEAKVYKAETVEDAAQVLEQAQPRGDRPRLRHGGGAGAAQGARALRPAHEARRRRQVRHPPGRRPHAGAHERAARRGRTSPTTTSVEMDEINPTCRRPTSRWWSAPTTW